MSILEVIVKTHIEDEETFYTALYLDSLESSYSEISAIKKCLKSNNINNDFSVITMLFKNNEWVYVIKLDD